MQSLIKSVVQHLGNCLLAFLPRVKGDNGYHSHVCMVNMKLKQAGLALPSDDEIHLPEPPQLCSYMLYFSCLIQAKMAAGSSYKITVQTLVVVNFSSNSCQESALFPNHCSKFMNLKTGTEPRLAL